MWTFWLRKSIKRVQNCHRFVNRLFWQTISVFPPAQETMGIKINLTRIRIGIGLIERNQCTTEVYKLKNNVKKQRKYIQNVNYHSHLVMQITKQFYFLFHLKNVQYLCITTCFHSEFSQKYPPPTQILCRLVLGFLNTFLFNYWGQKRQVAVEKRLLTNFIWSLYIMNG